jgi:hypothetical protein
LPRRPAPIRSIDLVDDRQRDLDPPGTVPLDVPRVMAEQHRRGTEVVGPPLT